ncbi:hypothetical protein [Duganella sp. Root1480D1]|uniref:hypothetical protein n=1 Tax=Duganella sp. Root1480D1 TaxID=1736471 RepID=UPI0007099A5B|nr:hypothetical protein [Duganella sp. Root1480D1]KQZ32447.1 hypothetical protein ASD58_07360 [Duganella sp. Root1480D1]
MKLSSKAALFSGLGFPGLGQMLVLKRRTRGLVFMVPALSVFIWLMYGLWKATSVLMDEALSGALPPDPILIAQRLTKASIMPGASAAGWILFACWIASIVDALLTRDQA